MTSSGFRHHALLYAGVDEFVGGVSEFLADGLAAGQPALVMTSAAKLPRLRAALGPEVELADMGEVGRNPARIIPVWRAFADAHRDAPTLWGVGEPVWAGRSPAEMVECHQHEALLNIAFRHERSFHLMCPYDVSTLAPTVIDTARTTHPRVRGAGAAPAPGTVGFTGVDGAQLLAEPLPPPPSELAVEHFAAHDLRMVRDLVRAVAAEHHLAPATAADIVLAVDEVAANSRRYGGGGTLRAWVEGDAMVFEIADRGHITDALVGRRCPGSGAIGGRGLWIANQVCDLVQVRSSEAGTVVRLHVADRRPVAV